MFEQHGPIKKERNMESWMRHFMFSSKMILTDIDREW